MVKYLINNFCFRTFCLGACSLVCVSVVNGQLVDVPKEEQPVTLPYVLYETYDRPGNIIVYFSETLGTTCLIWEDGFIAWNEDRSKKFFTTKFEPKQIKEFIRKIKDHYEQGVQRLGGKRFPFPFVTLHPSNRFLDLQIADSEHLQRDFWSLSIVNYYEKHGVDSIDINIDNYEKIFPFKVDLESSANEYYWPQNRKNSEKLSKEDIAMMINRLKEDIDHLLFCKKMIFSLLPTDRASFSVIELRMKNRVRKIALQYGTRISEYHYVYTDKNMEDITTSLSDRIRRIFDIP